MKGTAAELDFMLEDAGEPAVFSRGASTIASTYGLLEKKQIVGQADGAIEIVGNDVTLAVRDGTQGTATIDDAVTVGGIAYRIRDLGVAQSDGLRLLTVAGG